MVDEDNSIKQCALCGKNQDEVAKMFIRPSIVADWGVCEKCANKCVNISDSSSFVEEEGDSLDYGEDFTPKALYDHLEEYVIGQEDAKKVLAVSAYNHYKRIRHSEEVKDDLGIDIYKSNVIMIGPSGCGKTLLASALAKKLKVPFSMADATTLTEAGYVGDDVENILTRLLQAAGNDIEKAQKGIVYIDEIDKICRKSEGNSSVRDVSGEGVQQSLLKLVEGTIVSVPAQGGKKGMQQDYVQMNTTNILFICAGAFEGLDKIILSRQTGTSIGFGASLNGKGKDCKVDVSTVRSTDLIKYGIIPEFTGRFPIIVTLKELTEKQLIDILVVPRNALLKQYQTLFSMDDVTLKLEDDALKYVASQAMEKKIGARGLRAILEDMLLDLMFELPNCDKSEMVIDGELAKKGKIYLKDLKKRGKK